MALTPAHTDPNRADVIKHIKSLEKKADGAAGDQLKEEFNIGDKQSTVIVSPNAAKKILNNG